MREHICAICIFLAMIGTILILSSCAKFDTQNRNIQDWRIETSSKDGECHIVINRVYDIIGQDNSIKLKKPKGVN